MVVVSAAAAVAASSSSSSSSLAAARTGAARGALACVVYVSEGRRMDVLKAIESVALSKRITKPNEMTKTKRDDDDETYNNNAVKLVKTFIDEPYNRTGFTFAVRTDDDFDDAVNGGDNNTFVVLDGKANNEQRKKKVSRLIANKVHEVATSAFMEIGSFKKHSATHPRLGIVDHVSVHPIGTCDMDVAKEAARAVGRRFGDELGVNAYMYGHATMVKGGDGGIGGEASAKSGREKDTESNRGRRELAEIRRKLGYFSANGENETWVGASDVYNRMQKWEVKPDFGSSEKSDVEEKGVCCVGAVPFVVNYNVPMICELSDESQAKLALDLGKQIAKRVSQRNESDGLPNVQSMALMRTTTTSPSLRNNKLKIEIACNLLDETSSTTRTQLQKKIEELMPELLVENVLRGVKLNGASCQIGRGYVTNLQPQDFLDAVSSTSSDDTAS
ncbi:unnamed protein product [Bathycoccus prasinos]